MSRDVAKFLNDLAKDHALKQAETAVDVAVGFWLGLFEGLSYVHSEHFQPFSASRRGYDASYGFIKYLITFN